MKRKVLFIINPLSGGKNKKNIPSLIEKFIDRDKISPLIIYTESAGHAVELTKEFVEKDYDTIVAVGGDGSVNEVARCLVGTNVKLGIIPLGSGNGLARHLHIPLKSEEAILAINRGEILKMDVCKLNDNYFFSGAGVGFMGDVVHSLKNSKLRGFVGYFFHSTKHYLSYRAAKLKIEADGNIYEGKYFAVNISNSNQFGYNIKIAPDADLTDGKVELVIAKRIARWHVLGLMFDTITDRFIKNKKIIYQHSPSVTIYFDGEIKAHIDGDAVMIKDKAEISILPLNLNVIVP